MSDAGAPHSLPASAQAGTWQRAVRAGHTHLLRKCFSPEQLAGKLRAMEFPNVEDAYVCRETIYNTIYALLVGELRKGIDNLPAARQAPRPPSGGMDHSGQIPDMLSIHVRPPEIEDRVIPDHWEEDLIKGKANASAEGPLVERISGYLMLVRMRDATATSVVESFSAVLNRIPLAARKSMTYD